MSKIEYIIHALAMKKNEFAKEIGTTPGQLTRILKGDGILTYNQLKLLSEKYNININWLLTGSGEIFNNNDYHKEVNTVNESIIRYGANETEDKEQIKKLIKDKEPTIVLDGINYIGLQTIYKLILNYEKKLAEEKINYLETLLAKTYNK
jgi:transcriptional regulator with XRE-family HTH domain